MELLGRHPCGGVARREKKTFFQLPLCSDRNFLYVSVAFSPHSLSKSPQFSFSKFTYRAMTIEAREAFGGVIDPNLSLLISQRVLATSVAKHVIDHTVAASRIRMANPCWFEARVGSGRGSGSRGLRRAPPCRPL